MRSCREFLRYVFFVGEVMPVRQLNYWRAHVPSAHYINLYGSTEMYMCCYYEVDREYAETDTLPIGAPAEGPGSWSWMKWTGRSFRA